MSCVHDTHTKKNTHKDTDTHTHTHNRRSEVCTRQGPSLLAPPVNLHSCRQAHIIKHILPLNTLKPTHKGMPVYVQYAQGYGYLSDGHPALLVCA